MNFDKDSFDRILDNIGDGLYVVDLDKTISYWNKAAEDISGYSAVEVIGRSCSDNILNHVDAEGNGLCFGMCPLTQCVADEKLHEFEIYMHHKDGHRIPISVRTSALSNAEGKVIGAIELFTDISNRSATQLRIKELEKLALLDRLTQLANRNYIEKEIQNRFDEKKRFDVLFGILFIDIDHFKNFNDMYGHSTGDDVLKFVANTFIANSRPFDLYGRWGGEEFIGVIRYITYRELEQMGNRLRSLVESSFIMHDNKKLHVTISIGATMVRDDDTIDSIIKRADKLLYESKSAGRNRLTAG
jgi:diguanylate cyclase (GGDEF)-like protein/PAS domain S-box-containing protein